MTIKVNMVDHQKIFYSGRFITNQPVAQLKNKELLAHLLQSSDDIGILRPRLSETFAQFLNPGKNQDVRFAKFLLEHNEFFEHIKPYLLRYFKDAARREYSIFQTQIDPCENDVAVDILLSNKKSFDLLEPQKMFQDAIETYVKKWQKDLESLSIINTLLENKKSFDVIAPNLLHIFDFAIKNPSPRYLDIIKVLLRNSLSYQAIESCLPLILKEISTDSSRYRHPVVSILLYNERSFNKLASQLSLFFASAALARNFDLIFCFLKNQKCCSWLFTGVHREQNFKILDYLLTFDQFSLRIRQISYDLFNDACEKGPHNCHKLISVLIENNLVDGHSFTGQFLFEKLQDALCNFIRPKLQHQTHVRRASLAKEDPHYLSFTKFQSLESLSEKVEKFGRFQVQSYKTTQPYATEFPDKKNTDLQLFRCIVSSSWFSDEMKISGDEFVGQLVIPAVELDVELIKTELVTNKFIEKKLSQASLETLQGLQKACQKHQKSLALDSLTAKIISDKERIREIQTGNNNTYSFSLSHLDFLPRRTFRVTW